ncbi:hypothetical protein GQ457_06G008630 [Hibiscus cannabinus]
MNVEPSNVVALAKKALSASKQAASLAEDLKLDLDDSLSNSLGSANSLLCQLRRKQLRSRRNDVRRKLSQSSDPNDPLQLFLWCPETKQFLTAEEESDLIIQVQQLTPDTGIEAKQLMRQHVRNLLSVMSPKERNIFRLRFGIKEGAAVRVESRALYKLKQCLVKQGLDAYEDLLV